MSHRLPLASAAQEEGYEIHVATSHGACLDQIRSHGFGHHIVPFVRSGQNPLYELRTMLCLVSLFLRLKPNLVHLVTIKPILYGGIAARLAGVGAVVSAVSGLGTVFLSDSIFGRVRRWAVILLYREAFKQKRLTVIFQNPHDCEVLMQVNALKNEQAKLIRGSGVKLTDYPYLPELEGKTVVVMAARLLRDKGVVEYVEAAKLLKARGLSIEFRLMGSADLGNPTGITQKELDLWKRESNVNVLPFRTDIASEYANANIVCLPSYREGLPKSLIEAAACGRAVVTTDVPGCRDSIIPGVTGLLVPIKDHLALANAIQTLTEQPELRSRMGSAGRKLSEKEFIIEKIVQEHLAIYRELAE